MDRKYIETVTFKAFLSVLKKNNMYHCFRFNVRTMDPEMRLYDHLSIGSCYDNCFSGVSSMGELLKKLDTMTGGMKVIENDNMSEQIFVNFLANVLLHEFVERYVHEQNNSQRNCAMIMDDLCKDVFESACRRLYGEDFVNLLEGNDDINPQTMVHPDFEDEITMDRIRQMFLGEGEDFDRFI